MNEEYSAYWYKNKPWEVNITKRRQPWLYDDSIEHRKATKKEIDMYNHGKTFYQNGKFSAMKKAPEKSWEKLFDFMGRNEFSVQDFLACVCANFGRADNDNTYETQIAVGGIIYDIKIEKLKNL